MLEPELEIVDPHHHLWDNRRYTEFRGGSRQFAFRQKVYMLPEILEDIGDGHNVIGTVYVQANSFHWRTSAENSEFGPVGEVEVCQGIAALCDSGVYGQGHKGSGGVQRVCWSVASSLCAASSP